MKSCLSECKQTRNMACLPDCILKQNQMTDDSGKFDPAKAKEHLKSQMKDATYVRKFESFVNIFVISLSQSSQLTQ